MYILSSSRAVEEGKEKWVKKEEKGTLDQREGRDHLERKETQDLM